MINGEEMRRVRLSRNLSQRDISNYTKINVRTIGAIERMEIEPSQEQYDAYIKAVYVLEKDEIKTNKNTKTK